MFVLIATTDLHTDQHTERDRAVDGELVSPVVLDCPNPLCEVCAHAWFGLTSHGCTDQAMVVDRPGVTEAALTAIYVQLGIPLEQAAAPAPCLELAVALPRRDADVLLRMVVELGIDRFTPLQAERSVGPDPLKPERGATIVREALVTASRVDRASVMARAITEGLVSFRERARDPRPWVSSRPAHHG